MCHLLGFQHHLQKQEVSKCYQCDDRPSTMCIERLFVLTCSFSLDCIASVDCCSQIMISYSPIKIILL